MLTRPLLYVLPLAVLLLTLPLAAQTPAPTGGLAGNWHFMLNAQDGVHEIDASLKVAEGKVTGKWGPSDVAGSFTGGQFDLTFPFDYNQGSMSGSMHLKGKLDGDKLNGAWEFAGYNGDFAAARVK